MWTFVKVPQINPVGGRGAQKGKMKTQDLKYDTLKGEVEVEVEGNARRNA